MIHSELLEVQIIYDYGKMLELSEHVRNMSAFASATRKYG